MKLDVSTSQLYGLIFYALLKKKYYSGAQQLVETGCIRIRHILVGCVILKEAANDWSTSQLEKEKIQRLNKAFTQRAIRITSSIYEADKKNKKEKDSNKKSADDKNSTDDNELGDRVMHSGRLLLNHGYIEDAIKTQNRTFLDNQTVKQILNTMWYGEEKRTLQRDAIFIILAVIHPLLMPLLMFTMEAPPFVWFYKQYKLPFMKVFIHFLAFLAFLITYAYMLLFDYSDGISYSDYFIIAWMTGFFLDENKQHLVAIKRKRWGNYISDWWNRLDWISIFTYLVGMLMKLGNGSPYKDLAKVFLVMAFILLCIRILNTFCMSEMLGPKLVMIQKMDTLAFMMIMTVIMMCYNVSFHALMYPNSEFSYSQFEKVVKNGYWMLFGELNLDADSVSEPDCSFNETIYNTGVLVRCPTQLGSYITPYLKALYGLIAVILLLNLLIAMYSDTFSQVHQQSEFYWSQLQTDFLEEYSTKTIFPVHMQLLALPMCLVQFIVWFCCPFLCGKIKDIISNDDIDWSDDDEDDSDTLNNQPMFVRVFIYNTNFDLKLRTTRKAEGDGAMKARCEMDIVEEDKVTVLQKQIETNNKKMEKQFQKSNKRNDKMIKLGKDAIKDDWSGDESKAESSSDEEAMSSDFDGEDCEVQ